MRWARRRRPNALRVGYSIRPRRARLGSLNSCAAAEGLGYLLRSDALRQGVTQTWLPTETRLPKGDGVRYQGHQPAVAAVTALKETHVFAAAEARSLGEEIRTRIGGPVSEPENGPRH